jgi:hypothetical protein
MAARPLQPESLVSDNQIQEEEHTGTDDRQIDCLHDVGQTLNRQFTKSINWRQLPRQLLHVRKGKEAESDVWMRSQAITQGRWIKERQVDTKRVWTFLLLVSYRQGLCMVVQQRLQRLGFMLGQTTDTSLHE